MGTPQYQSWSGDCSSANSNSSVLEKLDVFKKPLDPDLLKKIRRRKVKVLDEDEYVEKVEGIIERDFFPELEKLKAQNEYIEAKDRNDVVTMNRLREKFSGGRPNTDKTFGGRLASPATFETPQDAPRENDPRRGEDRYNIGGHDNEPSDEGANKMETEEGKEVVNLDQFLAKHTSEDNESFNEIQEEQLKKHQIKNSWMYKDEKLYLENKAKEMELPSIEQQAELPVKPLDVETWTYQNINSVFHNPSGVELSEQEKIELAKKQKVIVHDNTRLTKTPWKSEKQLEALRREAEKQKEISAGKVGIDGKELRRPETPSVNGFKMMSMAPSPAFSASESPLMTWGEVESTPYRLEGCETPLSVGQNGPGYSMPQVPERDKIAKELADKNSRYYRERKQKAIAQVKSSMKGGRPGSGLAGMSPAAQRLASKKLGIRLSTDDMLRASYTPTPLRSASTPTPKRSGLTPASVRTDRMGKRGSQMTPDRLGVRTPSKEGITDNLLNLKTKARTEEEGNRILNTDNLLNIRGSTVKRARAQDFFIKPTD